jgi:hypothetical protein
VAVVEVGGKGKKGKAPGGREEKWTYHPHSPIHRLPIWMEEIYLKSLIKHQSISH